MRSGGDLMGALLPLGTLAARAVVHRLSHIRLSRQGGCAHRDGFYGRESMGDRLNDKVALVSGAGSSGPGWGNGKATAVLFAREGAKVHAADLKIDAAVETKRII